MGASSSREHLGRHPEKPRLSHHRHASRCLGDCLACAVGPLPTLRLLHARRSCRRHRGLVVTLARRLAPPPWGFARRHPRLAHVRRRMDVDVEALVLRQQWRDAVPPLWAATPPPAGRINQRDHSPPCWSATCRKPVDGGTGGDTSAVVARPRARLSSFPHCPPPSSSPLTPSWFPTEGTRRFCASLAAAAPCSIRGPGPAYRSHNVRLRVGIHTKGDVCPFANQPSNHARRHGCKRGATRYTQEVQMH